MAMKTVLKWVLFGVFCLIGVGILASFGFLYVKSKAKEIEWKTESAAVTDLTKKTVATGSIVPREQVDVKPKVTGTLDEIKVEPGSEVEKDAQIAKVRIIPDAGAVNNADSQVRSAQIALDNAKRELDRDEGLYKKGVVSEAELMKFRTDYALAQQQLNLATSNLQLVREGQTRAQGKTSTLFVTATVKGTVIDVPLKVGAPVIQANSFNPGTTIATIANMGDMIFDGHVDESEVGKIKKGMKLAIKIGALEKESFDGVLEFIAPQGKEIDGAIQFEIKAAIKQKAGLYLRANYSANADIVLDEKKKVLAVREAVVQYDGDKPFVEIETSPQTFVKKDVVLGLSDGIKVEVVSGVTAADKIKLPDNAGPAKTEAGTGSAGSAGSADKKSTKK
jgi:HlyD family secretion protein